MKFVKPSKNAECHCGSGKEYQSCCLAKDETEQALNPLEIKLTGLIFCLATKEPLNLGTNFPLFEPGTPFNKNTGAKDRLAQEPILTREELKDFLIPYILLNRNMGWYYQNQEIDALKDTLQYRFSDGTILTGNEILRHPYVRVLPLELLPIIPVAKKKPRGEVLEAHFPIAPASTSGFASNERMDLEMAYLRVFQESINAKISVYLVKGTDSRQNQALALNSIKTLAPGSLECSVSLSLNRKEELEATRLNATVNWKELSSSIQWGPYFALDAKERVLYLHRSHKVFERLSLFSENESAIPGENGLKLIASGHRQISACLKSLRTLASQNELVLHFDATRRELSRNEFRTHLFIESSGGFYIAHSALDKEDNPHVFWNLPSVGTSLCKLLSEGIGTLSEGGAHAIARRRPGTERDRELWILRHLGAAALALIDITSLMEKTRHIFTNDLAKQLEDGKKGLLEKLSALVLTREGFTKESDESAFSRNFPGFIENTLKDFCTTEKHSDVVYVPGEEWGMRGELIFVAQLFRSILQWYSVDSKGQIFTRPKSPVLQHLSEWASGEYVQSASLEARPSDAKLYFLPEKSTPNLMACLLPLEKMGCSIYLDGRALDYLDPADLTTDFEVVEHEAEGSSKIDWFELNPKVFFKGKELSREEAHELSRTGIIKHQGRWYQLCDRTVPSVEALDHFWARIARTSNQSTRGAENSTYLKLPRHQILELLVLRQKGIVVNGGPRWQEICAFYDSMGNPDRHDPSLANEALKAFQLSGVQWINDLYRLGLGGILADDMGLGKTIQTLCFLDALRKKGELGLVLVVVPTSLIYNWMTEANRFTPELTIKFIHPKNFQEFKDEKQSSGVYLTTYGLLSEHEELYQGVSWNAVIFDEAQNLKNISAQRTTCARNLKAGFKLCLTGTPMENHLGEFFSLIDLVVPGALGDLRHFRNTFVNKGSLLPKEVDFLKLKIKPLVLRRHKAQILTELPEKTESELKLPFGKQQKKIYRNIAIAWNDKVQESLSLNGEAKSRLVMLTALLRLRQVCSYPKTVPNIRYTEEAPKITLLKDMATQIVESGESVLVFTQFLGTQSKLFEELKSLLPNRVWIINGATPLKERARILDTFNLNPGGGVLLMTLKTGGVGLNLTKASYVFHVEPWWNPAVENQASDRVHRMGQTKKVQIYRMIMEESIEEKIESLKRKKQNCFSSLFGMEESENAAVGESRLTVEDFQHLIS